VAGLCLYIAASLSVRVRDHAPCVRTAERLPWSGGSALSLFAVSLSLSLSRVSSQGLCAKGLCVKGLCVKGLCVKGLCVKGLCAKGCAPRAVRQRAVCQRAVRQRAVRQRAVRQRAVRHKGLCAKDCAPRTVRQGLCANLLCCVSKGLCVKGLCAIKGCAPRTVRQGLCANLLCISLSLSFLSLSLLECAITRVCGLQSVSLEWWEGSVSVSLRLSLSLSVRVRDHAPCVRAAERLPWSGGSALSLFAIARPGDWLSLVPSAWCSLVPSAA
jgi:hypothetical protein